MSELLRLCEWLGFSDAIRYAKYLGIDATKSDFFRAYSAADFPMRLSSTDNQLFGFTPSTLDGGYPYSLWAEWSSVKNEWESEEGTLCDLFSVVDIAKSLYQRHYGTNETVWIIDDIPFGDEHIKPVPVYWKTGKTHEFEPDFRMIKWGDISNDYCANALELSRKHVEIIVRRALGQPEPKGPELAKATPPIPIPAFCDNAHESYPSELHAAVMLWEGLYLRGERSPHHGHTQSAKLWLEKNGDKLPTTHLSNHGSGAWIDRLTSITNPEAKKQKR